MSAAAGSSFTDAGPGQEGTDSAEADKPPEPPEEEPPEQAPRGDGRPRHAAQGAILPWMLPAIMRKHIYTGAMGSVYITLLWGGIFIAAYGEAIGLTFRHWGLLGGLGSFALSFQMLGAYLARRLGRRRPIWFACCLAARLCRGLAVCLAFYFSRWNPAFGGAVFVGLIALGCACVSVAIPVWFSWFADIIPTEQHGSFWGRRSAWTSLASFAVLVPAGFVLDLVPDGLKAEALLAIFAVGIVLGCLDLFIHNTIPEPPLAPERGSRFWPQVVAVLKNGDFRPWLRFRCAWNFSMSLGGCMFMVFCVKELGFKRNLLGATLVMGALPLVVNMLVSPRMGRLIDKLGTRPVLTASHLAWATMPLFVFFATPQTALIVMAASSVMSSVACNTAINAATKFQTRIAPRPERAMYMAVSTCLGSLASGLGAIAAGEVLHSLDGLSWSAGGKVLTGFHVLFAVSFVLRASSTVLLRRLPAPAREVTVFARAQGRVA